MARRLARRDALGLGEHVPALAVHGPVLDDLINRPRRQQRPSLALMAGLRTRLAARRTLAALGRAGRVLARRLGGVARRALALALELRDALLLATHLCRQRLDLLDQPLVVRGELQQHPRHGVAALVVDRLGLGPLHTTRFAAARLCPPGALNAYGNVRLSRDSSACRRPRTRLRRITLKVQRDGRSVNVEVRADGEGTVSHAGAALLGEVADTLGLTRRSRTSSATCANAARPTTPGAWCASWR